MPAPTPISFRYGNDGLLGAAAARVGYNNGLQSLLTQQQQQQQRQQAMDMNFINQQHQSEVQQDEFNAGLDAQKQQQANQLQQAHDLTIARQTGASSDPNYFSKTSPMVAAITDAKLARLQSIVGDSGVDTTGYEASLKDPNVPADLIYKSAEDDAKRAKRDRGTAAKQAILKEAAGAGAQLPPATVAALQGAVSDESTTPEQFRTALLGATSAQHVQSRQDSRTQTNLQLNEIDNQARGIQQQMKDVEKRLQASGYDPNTTAPADFNPTQGLEGGVFSRMAQRIGDREVPGYTADYTNGGDQQGLADYTVYAKLKRQLDDLNAQRQQVVGGGQPQAVSPAATSGGPVRVTSPDQAANLPSGTQFITPDGQLRVKH